MLWSKRRPAVLSTCRHGREANLPPMQGRMDRRGYAGRPGILGVGTQARMDTTRAGRADHVMSERWLPIPGLDRYEVSDMGRIKNRSTGRVLKTNTQDGYATFFPRRGRKVWVHRCVLNAFVGPCPDGMECRHLDGNRRNNALSNLKWGTRIEQAMDRVRHQTVARGEEKPGRKLSCESVREIRSAYNSEASRALAKRFGVSHTTIQSIIRKQKWRHVL